MQEKPQRQTEEAVRVLLDGAGWSAQDIEAARAVCLSRHSLAQLVAVASLANTWAATGVTSADVLLFLRLSPAADAEQLVTLGQGQPVRFVCQALISGVHPTLISALWNTAMQIGLPEDGFDAAGWVATGVLRPRKRTYASNGPQQVLADIRPWVDEFGPGAWRWLLQDDPPTLDRARAESAGWARDRETLNFYLAMQGAYDRTALVDPPPLGLPPVPSTP